MLTEGKGKAMGVKRSEGQLPTNTRERTYAPWIVDEAQYLMEGEVKVDDDGTVYGRTSDVSSDDHKVGTDAWIKASKSEAGSLAQYLRSHFAKELKAKGLKVSTKYVKGEHVSVMLRPLGSSDEGTEEAKEEGTEDEGTKEEGAEAAA